ncbi:MAG: tRNA lysidine(34) synthetase TilS [Bacteriovorax sp.]|nr:tRNA lysidine(34) synthetase TilS [Bacteriovorax sp.]
MNRSSIYPRQFIKHLQHFMDSLQLIHGDKLIVVAVSGGVDSLALMYALNTICKGRLRVLHINHGTRGECEQEELAVIKHAELLGLEIDVFKFSLSLEESNFEAVARNLRAHIYKQYIRKNYWVYTAHHLDDSFEWSMIQSFKQSGLASTLGIPVFNKGLVRPFMCVSKNHIIRYARSLQLSWAQDSSNRNTRFERNFFRMHLTQTIHHRYLQYLRHYVSRQNELALKLEKHRSLFLEKASVQKTSRLIEKRETSGALVLKSRDFSFHKEEIKDWIHFFSKKNRGEIDREVDKLISAHRKIKDDKKELKMKGPLSFSGGVKIFVLDDYLLILNDLHWEYYRKCDDEILRLLNDGAQITEVLSTKASKRFFPYLTLLSAKNSDKSSKLVHPLLPKSTKWLKDHKRPYNYYPLIPKKMREKLIHSAVILDSSILGL